MTIRTIAGAAMLFGLFGCAEGDAPKPASTSSAASAPTTKPTGPTKPAATAATPAVTASAAEASADDDIPTLEDFEEEAEEQITAANMDDELGKLTKEIDSDKE